MDVEGSRIETVEPGLTEIETSLPTNRYAQGREGTERVDREPPNKMIASKLFPSIDGRCERAQPDDQNHKENKSQRRQFVNGSLLDHNEQFGPAPAGAFGEPEQTPALVHPHTRSRQSSISANAGPSQRQGAHRRSPNQRASLAESWANFAITSGIQHREFADPGDPSLSTTSVAQHFHEAAIDSLLFATDFRHPEGENPTSYRQI